MAGVFEQDKDRNVLPNWRLYRRTKRSKELAYSGKALTKYDSRIITRTTGEEPNKGIILEESITCKVYNEIVEDIAYEISADGRNPALQNLAKTYLSHNSVPEVVLFDRTKIISGIIRCKQSLKKYPRNAIMYMDIALYYSSIGQNGEAEREMMKGFLLSRNSRYIVRAAIRLFTHTRNTEKLLYVLRHTQLVGQDPWVTASALSSEKALNLKPRTKTAAIKLLKRAAHTYESISELAASYAKVIAESGKLGIASEYLELALKKPNENTLAQAEWMSNKWQRFRKITDHMSFPDDYEASMLKSYYSGEWDNAKSCIRQWHNDLPYSIRPIMYGFSIAVNKLGDFVEAIDIMEMGRDASWNNPVYINNMAYVYAHQDMVAKAEGIINNYEIKYLDDYIKMELTATRGMIEYRKNNREEGQRKYSMALKYGTNTSNAKKKLAIVNQLREEIIWAIRNNYSISNLESIEKYVDKIEDKSESILEVKREILQQLLAYRVTSSTNKLIEVVDPQGLFDS